MPVLACQSCDVLISVSTIPGGNPTAVKAGYALEYAYCATCGAHVCSECLAKKATPPQTLNSCPRCGSRLAPGCEQHALDVVMGKFKVKDTWEGVR